MHIPFLRNHFQGVFRLKFRQSKQIVRSMRASLRRPVLTILSAAVLVITILGAHPDTASAQSHVLQSDSELWVDGTSNKSDWTVQATEMEGTATIDGTSLTPSAVRMTVPSATIKSERSTIMDRLMHGALKVDEHPTITYELTNASSDGSMLTTTGNLTIAGVTQPIEMEVTLEETPNGLRYAGSVPIKMSDFNIKPPVAMFGALRTGDEVTVGFDVVFAPEG